MIGAGFAMVPAWLVRKGVTGNELLVYVHLALYGRFNPGSAEYEECRPSRKTLAESTGRSISTIDRALAGLEEKGAIVGDVIFDARTGAQRPTVYRLVFGRVEQTHPAPPDSDSTDTSGDDCARVEAEARDTAGDGGESSPATGGDCHRRRGGIVTGDAQSITKEPEPETHTPPALDEKVTTADTTGPKRGNGQLFSQEDRDTLNAVVADVVRQRSWPAGKVAEAIRAALVEGYDASVIATKMRELAADAETRWPGRLVHSLNVAAVNTPPARPAPTRSDNRPRCARHPGEAADACGGCRGELIAAKDATSGVYANRIKGDLAAQAAAGAAPGTRGAAALSACRATKSRK
jgi:hypothetical protein